MNKKIRVLFYTELWANAGIESVIMSLFRNMDLSLFSVDIMASQNLTDFYDEEIRKLGGHKIISLNKQFDNPARRMIANQAAFKNVLLQNHYDIVHLHMCNAASMKYGKIAKQVGVKVVAFHSHNTNLSTNHRIVKTAVHNYCKFRYERYADLLFSCSDLASIWMFSKKSIKRNNVILIKNAIDLERFEFNQVEREKLRHRMGLEGKFVVGHIGRFAVAKNHTFLVDVFSEIHRYNNNSMLLLIGEGEDEKMIRDKVQTLGLTDSVIFYGTTNEIPKMLWCMDAFVLPSLFEGNPVVGIEAQAASTPCFFSDTITKMCKLTDIVEYISLKAYPKIWARKILKSSGTVRLSTKSIMSQEGYNIKQVVKALQNTYINCLKRKKKHK